MKMTSRNACIRSFMSLVALLSPIAPAIAETEVIIDTPAQETLVQNGGTYTISGHVYYSYSDSRYPNRVWVTAKVSSTGAIVAQGLASWGGWSGDLFSKQFTAPSFDFYTHITTIAAAEDDDTDSTVLAYGYSYFYIGP